MEENLKIRESHLNQTETVLSEIVKQIKAFKSISNKSMRQISLLFKDKPGALKKLKISFDDETEIDRLKDENSYKLNARNKLGLKSNEDWIYNLNIGNVMLLSPLSFDDLHCSFILDNVSRRSNQELSKDMLLEKIVLLVVSYFSIGTEMRFLHENVSVNS